MVDLQVLTTADLRTSLLSVSVAGENAVQVVQCLVDAGSRPGVGKKTTADRWRWETHSFFCLEIDRPANIMLVEPDLLVIRCQVIDKGLFFRRVELRAVGDHPVHGCLPISRRLVCRSDAVRGVADRAATLHQGQSIRSDSSAASSA